MLINRKTLRAVTHIHTQVNINEQIKYKSRDRIVLYRFCNMQK